MTYSLNSRARVRAERDRAREALRVVARRQKNTAQRRRNRELERVRVNAARCVAAAAENADFLDEICADRAASLYARRLAHIISEETGQKGIAYQKAVLSKLLDQPVLQVALPDCVSDRKELEYCRVVCKGVAAAWSELKWGIGKDRYLARNVIEAAVMAVDDDRCVVAAAKCVGMNRRTVQRGVKRRTLLNLRTDGEVWAKTYRRKRKDCMNQETIDSVIAWWTEETRVSPCKKDVRRKRTGFKTTISHATHWLEESQLDFYTRFKAAHPGKCSLVSFRRLKPFFVKRLRDFNSCCCKYHQEMAEITAAFNSMRAHSVHLQKGATTCSCGCPTLCCRPATRIGAMGAVSCQSLGHTYKRNSHLWEQTLCPRPVSSEWHNLECLKGECPNCGFHLLPICDQELDPANPNLLHWRRFEMVSAGKNKKGELKSIIRLEYKLTTTRSFLAFAKPKIAQFVMHQFVASWQDKECKRCLENLKENEVMSLIDFAENYSYKGQNEVQSQHWHNFQLTILVHITYTLNPDWNPLDSKSKRLRTDYFYYISDDRVHDSLYVQHCLTLHWQHMVRSGKTPVRHVVWSDGCAGQFKGAKTWFYVSKYPSLTVTMETPVGCSLDWHFWGTGHGKGPHDGAGACVKQSLIKEQLKPNSTRLHGAADVRFLEVAMNMPNAAYPLARRVVHRHFILIGEKEVLRDKPLACKTVKGSRSLHSIRSVSPSNNVLLEVRDFSCFCPSCSLGRHSGGSCSYNMHVAPYRMVTLEPIDSAEAVQEQEDNDPDWEQEPDCNYLAAGLQAGDHFAVLADANDPEAQGAEFFVLLCTKPMHLFDQEPITDPWGSVVERGDEVVEGLYYRQQGRLPNSYVLLQNQGPAYLFSHLVCASKFTMIMASHRQKGGVAVYRLSPESLTHINEVVRTSMLRADLESEDEDNEEEEEDSDGFYDSDTESD